MMQHGAAAHDSDWRIPPSSSRGEKKPLSVIVYKSRAVAALQPSELRDLTLVAQARNAREAITGVMLYDDTHFFQWLEGPPNGVARVMDSIAGDRRHTDLQILEKRPAETRVFGDWSMKLATPTPIMTSWRQEVIAPPREIVDALRVQPKAAPALLVKLVAATGGVVHPVEADTNPRVRLGRTTEAVLKDVFLTAVIPHMAGADQEHGANRVRPPTARALELAELLVAADQDAAAGFIEDLVQSGSMVGALSTSLFEPTARRLGDLWDEDLCSEFDVTIALCRLQSAVRLLEASAPLRLPSNQIRPVVLIAPEPGELHRLGAAMDSSVLRNAGWAPQCEYPSNDLALQDLLSASWFDVLDLSLSAAFRRDHILPQITKTITEARHASRNPALLVMVGGRVFAETRLAGAEVGADHANTTARNVNQTILRTMTVSTTGTVSASETAEVTASVS